MSEAPAAPAAEPAPAAAPDQAAREPGATAAPGADTTPEAKPDRTFTQKELDEILERRLGKERRRREELQRRLAVTEELALKGRAPTTEQPKTETPKSGRPTRDGFDSYEDYLRADARWEAGQEVEGRLKKEREDSAKAKADQDRQQLEKSFREHAAKAAEKIEDFDDVLSSSQAMITNDMADAMMGEGEVGPLILHHLAKNPDESQRIAALPANRQAAEIGKLALKLSSGLSAPEPKKSSAAPAPIKPIVGKSPAADDEPDGKDTKTWIAWRERQIQAKRKGAQP